MLLATIPTLFYIDKLGRKPILTIGAIGMGTWSAPSLPEFLT